MKIIGIIMTYNCESLVQKAIDQIPKEEFDKLICTDDGSTDNTIEIVKKNNIEFIKNTEDLSKFIKTLAEPGDLVLFIGAGDINIISNEICLKL